MLQSRFFVVQVKQCIIVILQSYDESSLLTAIVPSFNLHNDSPQHRVKVAKMQILLRQKRYEPMHRQKRYEPMHRSFRFVPTRNVTLLVSAHLH
jgi:hypothetical protein